MKYHVIAAVAALGVALSGCATVVKGSNQAMSVTTPPAEGATCTLSNSRGSWTLTSPGSVTVMRSKTDLQIRCVKAGFQDGSATVPSGFEEWTLGNIILGGLVGIAIDWSSGAIQQYPDAVQVPMTPIGASAEPSAPATSNPGSGAGS